MKTFKEKGKYIYLKAKNCCFEIFRICAFNWNKIVYLHLHNKDDFNTKVE